MSVLHRVGSGRVREDFAKWAGAALALLIVAGGTALAASGHGIPLLAAVAGVVGFAAVRSAVRALPDRTLVAQAVRLVQGDPGIAVLSDARGRVVARSPSVPGKDSVDEASALLAPHFAEPDGMTAAMLARVAEQGAARHASGSEGGNVEALVQAVGETHRLWRLVPVAQSSPQPSVPMLLLSPRGTVLWRNAAAEDAIGTQVTHFGPASGLDAGDTALLGSGSWTGRSVSVREVAQDDGLRQVYLFPNEGPSEAPSDRAVLDSLPIPILRLGPGGVVEEGNRPAAELLNHDLSGGVALGELVEGLGRGVDQWIDAALAGVGLGHPETVQVALADTETHARVTLSRVLTGRGPRVIAVMNDATELKTLEAQFVQSQKMQAIGQLAGGIAHDFNNILTAISGYCDLLRLRRTLPPEDRSDLDHISQNTQRAAGIVNQLLAFSRKQKLKPEALDLRATLSDLTHLLEQLVGASVRIAYEHEADLAAIRGDSRQIGQVLMNLVINARDAMGEKGGQVRIVSRNQFLSVPREMGAVAIPAGRYVTVEVADDGSGIPPEILPRIFEPFYTTKDQGKGTGLGLSTVYGIVKQSGGYVFAAPREEGGTAFTLWFPAVTDIPAVVGDVGVNGSTPLPTVGEARTSRTVLLCEDEAPVRAIAARALGLRGFEVIEADCGEAALEAMNRSDLPPDVLLTDVVMPGLDGPAWVKEALRTHPATPVVFMSGYTEGTLDALKADLPEARLLPKPFSLDALISTVEGAVPR